MFVGRVKKSLKYMFVVVTLLLTWYLNLYTSYNNENNQAAMERDAQHANHAIFLKRERLLNLYSKYLHHQAVGTYQLHWLRNRVFNKNVFFNPYSEKDWRTLTTKIDVVPIKLVLQQAGKQSNYGATLLARQNNNFFKVILATAEDGSPNTLVDKRLRKYNWLEPNDLQYANYFGTQVAVSDFIWMLNVATPYKQFRQYRHEMRKNKKNIITADSKHLRNLIQIKVHALASLYGYAVLPSFPHRY